MRALILAALAVSLALAGCGGNSDDTSNSDTTTSETTTTTPLPPNVPPVVDLLVTVGGIKGNVSMVGDEVTFDASGSTDTDGDGLSVIAMVAIDANRTYPTQFLFQDGAFTPASYTFDRAGPVTITVAAVDKRNDSTTYITTVFVNEKFSGGATFTLVAPPSPGSVATACHGPTENGSIDPAMWAKVDFPVLNGTSYVVAKVAAGTARIAICEPGGTAVSAEGTEVTSNDGYAFQQPLAGIPSYYISVLSGTAQNTVSVEVTIHYEPKA